MVNINHSLKNYIFLFIMVAITACSPALQVQSVSPTPPPTNTAVPPTETQVPPTATPTATSTDTPTSTPTATTTNTPTSTPTPIPTSTPTHTPTKTVQVSSGGNLIVKYLVHQGPEVNLDAGIV